MSMKYEPSEVEVVSFIIYVTILCFANLNVRNTQITNVICNYMFEIILFSYLYLF